MGLANLVSGGKSTDPDANLMDVLLTSGGSVFIANPKKGKFAELYTGSLPTSEWNDEYFSYTYVATPACRIRVTFNIAGDYAYALTPTTTNGMPTDWKNITKTIVHKNVGETLDEPTGQSLAIWIL